MINDSNRLCGGLEVLCSVSEDGLTMPRFYFHVCNGTGETRDEEGVDLPDLETARLRALEGIRSILGEELNRGLLDLGGAIRISDRGGRLLLEVPFANAVEVRNDRSRA